MPRKPDPGKDALAAGEALLGLGARATRTAAGFDLLSPGNRRRWRAAFGGEEAARSAYVSGSHLTAAQRGHASTPATPAQALAHPGRYPKYIAHHMDELNELARKRGERQYSRGKSGRRVKRSSRDWTWTLTPEEFGQDVASGAGGEWSLRVSFRWKGQAQLWARQTRAPAGVVIVVDTGVKGAERYQVWFHYPSLNREGRRRRRR